MDIILLSFNMNKNNSENNQLLQWIIETRVKIQSNTCKEKSIHPRKVKRGYNLDQKARAIPKGEVSPVPGIFHEAPPSSSIPFCSIPTSFDDWNVTLHAISIIRGRPNCCINPLTCEERERKRESKKNRLEGMMVRCLPQGPTVFSFPLTRRSSQFLPPPTASFRTAG